MSFLLITLAAGVAALTVAFLPRRIAPPVVVLELVLGRRGNGLSVAR